MIKTHKIASSLAALTFLLAHGKMLSAQKPNCGEINAIARMARAISTAELAANREKAGESYRAQLVYAAKLIELAPQRQDAAVLLLNLIPKDEEQQHLLMTLGEHHCETESYHEMKMLASLEERLPRDLARAVLMVPGKIPEYVAYSITSVQDPHSDYALQMEKICRAKHAEFVAAVAKLPWEKKDRFQKYVFDSEECNALTLPEADNRLF
ncbi:MAG: hypothetical protein ABR990_10725 [Terracidiphilus sp.]